MTKPLLNLEAAPTDPIERIIWLSGVRAAVDRELDEAFGSAYFEARLQRRFETAVKAGPFAMKRALAFTRRENQRRGRTVRWGDGLDATSSAYEPRS